MSLAADTYGSSLLELLGVVNVFADAGDRYPEVSLGAVADRRPDIALLPSEPYAFREAHAEELRGELADVAGSSSTGEISSGGGRVPLPRRHDSMPSPRKSFAPDRVC